MDETFRQRDYLRLDTDHSHSMIPFHYPPYLFQMGKNKVVGILRKHILPTF
jgi:hypothetical protein